MTIVVIDPNIRIGGGMTYAGFEDVDGELALGPAVAVEKETNVHWPAIITGIDRLKRLVYLRIDWSKHDAQ